LDLGTLPIFSVGHSEPGYRSLGCSHHAEVCVPISLISFPSTTVIHHSKWSIFHLHSIHLIQSDRSSAIQALLRDISSVSSAWIDDLASNPTSAVFQLCDVGQVI
jgi:hypothetical protein